MNEERPDTSRRQAAERGRAPEPLRRRILLWIPAAVFGTAAVSFLSAAYRFLRPGAGNTEAGGWLSVGDLEELSAGAEPVRRELLIERAAGWSTSAERRAVYVLPGEGARVISAVCPHEGCEVEWSGERRQFLCPCHDSSFGPDGARLGGPAERDLARLPSRVTGGRLEVLPGDSVIPDEPGAAQVSG